jgi:hypothetical protein
VKNKIQINQNKKQSVIAYGELKKVKQYNQINQNKKQSVTAYGELIKCQTIQSNYNK